MVAAFGSLQTSTQAFTATTVLAGTSFENPSKDMLSGTVIARTANTLTLRRATFCGHDGDFESENHDVTVTVADATAVSEEGATGTFTGFETGHDPADPVDRAILATRKAVFPLRGLMP